MKILFIINPAAGNGRAKRYWEMNQERIFHEFGVQDYIFTKGPGNATEIARQASSSGKYDVIVSCGGDGTLNEIVNGMVFSNTKLSILPLGTGSDFGKTIGIRSLEDFIKAMKNGRTIRSDVAEVYFPDQNFKRFFINILEVGFGAQVMNYVNTHKKHGSSSFIIGLFATISRMKKFNINMKIEEMDYSFQTIELIVANGRYFGGGMLASPNSMIDDGIFDIHVLKPFSKFTTIFKLRDLVNGSYIDKNYAHNFKGDDIKLFTRNLLVEMDGEVVGKTPIYISSGPRIDLIVP